MNAITYSGTSASRNIVNSDLGTTGFQPDLVWSKSRTNPSGGFYNILCDTVRGQTSGYSNMLFSNTTDSENAGGGALPASTGGITTFNTNGYTLANGSSPSYWQNESGYTYVAWQWKAGGTAVSNTSGSITSSVSANTTAGFSIATYTGTAIAGTIGHGLGVAPQMIIVKPRSATITTDAWNVYHVSTGNTQFLVLNATDAATTASNRWNNTTPTSTVFSIGTVPSSVGVGYVAYCWTPIAGYSAFGSYTGNSSTDGPFTYLGFRPKYILIKCTSAGYDWVVYDSATGAYNVISNNLWPNLSNAEYSNTASGGLLIDLLSNGFKIRGTNTEVNNSGLTYIYMAFAENPFKYSNAR